MALIGETRALSHFTARQTLGQHPARELDAQRELKAVRRHAELPTEGAREVPGSEPGNGGRISQRDAHRRVPGDVVARAQERSRGRRCVSCRSPSYHQRPGQLAESFILPERRVVQAQRSMEASKASDDLRAGVYGDIERRRLREIHARSKSDRIDIHDDVVRRTVAIDRIARSMRFPGVQQGDRPDGHVEALASIVVTPREVEAEADLHFAMDVHAAGLGSRGRVLVPLDQTETGMPGVYSGRLDRSHREPAAQDRSRPPVATLGRLDDIIMIERTTLPFFRGDVQLVGELFRNTDRLDVQQPAIIVTGSWLTVKEQMPETYALRLAERGYTVFTFDFAGFGASGGSPRQAEVPDRKIADLIAAADFVDTLACVEPGTLTHLAICASAQYGLAALARGSRVARFISIAGWYHDPTSVAPFYGGMPGLTARVNIGRRALGRYLSTGETETVPAYDPGNEQAGMFFELDYYGNRARGAVPAWTNDMAAMSWWYWFTFDGLRAVARVQQPALFVHSDGCVFPDHVKAIHGQLRGPKRLVWSEGTQTDFYDQPAQVSVAVDAADAFLKELGNA